MSTRRHEPFKRQSHKMVKDTQTCLSVFDHFVKLALKGLIKKSKTSSTSKVKKKKQPDVVLDNEK